MKRSSHTTLGYWKSHFIEILFVKFYYKLFDVTKLIRTLLFNCVSATLQPFTLILTNPKGETITISSFSIRN